MLDYLVPSRTRRQLLRALWHDDIKANVSQLASRAGLSFASAYEELRHMEEAGLACSTRDGASVVFAANRSHPQGEALSKLLSNDEGRPRLSTATPTTHDGAQVKWNLMQLGAPLAAHEPASSALLSTEETLASALKLARKNATVARAYPVALAKSGRNLDFKDLAKRARALNEKRTLGFFLELAGRLQNDPTLLREAALLHDERVSRVVRFFRTPLRGKYAAALEEQNTPPLARKWHFRMNMGMDSFESLFRKHR